MMCLSPSFRRPKPAQHHQQGQSAASAMVQQQQRVSAAVLSWVAEISNKQDRKGSSHKQL